MAMAEVTEISTATATDSGVRPNMVSAEQLARVLSNGVLFASKDRARPILTNVRVDVTADDLRVEATDSYALIRESIPLAEGGQPGTFYVDRDVATSIVKACRAQRVGEVSVWTIGDVTMFEGRGWPITSSCYEMSWPNTEALWPTELAGLGAEAVGFGLQQMARLSKVTLPDGGSAKDRGAVLRLTYNGALKPMVARSTLGDLSVLVMPCRLG
jgi:hypothetical protein